MKVFINHYNPNLDVATRMLVLASAAYYARNTVGEREIYVLDGSGVDDEKLRNELAGIGCHYLNSSGRLSFAAAYNWAFRLAGGVGFTISASDIFVPHGWNALLMGKIGAGFRGMAMPYLSDSDYPTQQFPVISWRRTIHPLQATINVNYFAPECAASVGGLDEEFSGSFNDIDLLIRIRRAGLPVLLVDCGMVKHLGRMTVANSSSWDPKKDREILIRKYPALRSSKWWVKIYEKPFCNNLILSLLLRVGAIILPKCWFAKLIIVEVGFNNETRDSGR